MKRNARNKFSKLSAVLCLALTLVLVIGSVFAITASAAEESATLTFDDKAKRTTYSTTQQVWEENGIKFTNNKASATSNVGDYAKPVRLYAKSSISIEAPGEITKIVFDCESSSYATAMKNSIGNAATVSVSSDKVTATLNGTSSTFTITISAKVFVDAVTVTYTSASSPEPDAPACEHTNTTTNIKTAATCTTNGVQETVCVSCGKVTKTESISATGHGTTSKTETKATCTENGEIVEKCDKCGETVDTEVILATGHCFFNGICHNCQESASNSKGYFLVTNASDLKVGDKIVIVSKNSDYALSTNQKSNNRGAAAITTSDNSITINDSVQVITLVTGAADGTFAFYVEGYGENTTDGGNKSGYLYAASSSSNYLKTTKATIDIDSSWSIEISEDGTASIVAKGSSNKNVMQYNPNNGTPIFSCYASASQTALKVYRYTDIKENPNNSVNISGAQVNLGESLAIKYYVDICEHLNASDFSMSFTMNENEVTVTDYKVVDGQLVFTFGGIAPQCMGDNIVAKVMCGGKEVTSLNEYSVKANLVTLLAEHPDNAKLKTLIHDTLTYGAAAQVYRNHNTDNLVTDGVNGLISSTATPNTATTLEKSTSDVASFKSAGVKFDYINQIYVKVNVTDENADVVKVYADGAELTLEKSANGVYIAYTDAIAATELTTKTVKFTIEVDGEVVQTLDYSVSAYVTAMQNSTNEAMKALATALYNYGASAKAYKN